MQSHEKSRFTHLHLIALAFIALPLAAAFAENHTITTIASSVTTQATAITRLLSITAYVAGVGFALAGILQFKAHKENPTTTPLSKPVVMIVVAAALLFLPTVLEIAGNSLFGTGGVSSASAGGVKDLKGH
jgi:intracellular multiplication protein IcmD